jgi:hypothetical protein
MNIAKTVNCLGILLAGLVVLPSGSLAAKDDPAVALRAVAPPEMPATAARLVKKTKDSERETATAEVLRAATQLNPAALPLVVGAITRAVPEMAVTAAQVAAGLQPAQAPAIAQAAAVPARAGRVVAAVCTITPDQYRSVALAAAQAAPTARVEILNSVAQTLPDLRPHIERQLAGYGASAPPVALVLDRAVLARNASLSTLGPRDLTPAVPPAQHPPSPGTGTTGWGQAGRNYARP